jgi:hypothetical protein
MFGLAPRSSSNRTTAACLMPKCSALRLPVGPGSSPRSSIKLGMRVEHLPQANQIPAVGGFE